MIGDDYGDDPTKTKIGNAWSGRAQAQDVQLVGYNPYGDAGETEEGY